MLDGAARHAASRGAPEEGAALAEQAARLTPAGQPDAARERTVQAADYHFRAGRHGSQPGADPVGSRCVPGRPALRASLLLRLATIHYHLSGWPLAEQTFRQAVGKRRTTRPCARTQNRNSRSPGWWPGTFPLPCTGRRHRCARPSGQLTLT